MLEHTNATLSTMHHNELCVVGRREPTYTATRTD